MSETTITEHRESSPAPEGITEIEHAVHQILTEAFRPGCDCQSHAGEVDTNPRNPAGVLIYVGEQMAKLKCELLEMLSVDVQSTDPSQLTAKIPRVD
jgi:hypothetical protein